MEELIITDNLMLEYHTSDKKYLLTLFDTEGEYLEEVTLNAYQVRDLQYNLPSIDIDVEFESDEEED